MIVLSVRVETVWMHQPVETLGGKLASFEETKTMLVKPQSKRWAPFKNDGPSEVKVGIEHRLSGPQGTYSSVAVRVEISGRTDTSEESLRAATETLYKEVDRALDHYLDPQHALLCQRARSQQD